MNRMKRILTILAAIAMMVTSVSNVFCVTAEASSASGATGSGAVAQLHSAPRQDSTEEQLKQFQQVLDSIHAAGFETGVVHAAGSY